MKREGEEKESTLLFQKSRKRRPQWCGLFLIGGEGGVCGGGGRGLLWAGVVALTLSRTGESK